MYRRCDADGNPLRVGGITVPAASHWVRGASFSVGASPAALLQRLLADLRQRRGGRDHFLGEAQLEQGGTPGGERAVEGRSELLGRLDQLAGSAEGAGVGGEV